MQKRGISPVITTVLIALLAVAVIGLVLTFSINPVEKIKNQASDEKLCNEIEFSAGDFCYSTIESDFGNEYNLEFSSVNKAESLLDGFLISIDYGGETILVSTLPYSELASREAKKLHTEIIEGIEDIKQIEAIPRIESTGKNIVCGKNTKIFSWGEVKAC
jgi:hypothetical protein